MNLGQLRTTLRNLLNEPVAGFWSDAQLNSYLSLGASRVNSLIVAMRQEWFTIGVTFNTVVYVPNSVSNVYNLPGDIMEIRRLELIQDPTNPETSRVKIDEIKFPRTEAGGDWLFTSTGQPVRYIRKNQTIELLPPPDAVYLLRLFYTQRPLDITNDTMVPTTPVDFHDMIVFYAGMLAQKQNESDDSCPAGGEGNSFACMWGQRKMELMRTYQNMGGEELKAPEAYLEGII